MNIIAMTVAYLALDGVWLGFITKNFYSRELGTLARTAHGLSVDWFGILGAYVLAIAGIVYFVLPRAGGSVKKALIYGALYGAILYGVYDFTNRATLLNYSWKLAFADMLWGVVVCSIISAVGVYFE